MSGISHVHLAINGLLGILLLLSGYRSMRATARFASALLFLALGAAFGAHLGRPEWTFLLMGVLGVLGFLLGNVFFFVNLMVYGAAAGGLLAAGFTYAFTGAVGPVSPAVGGILGAILAVLLARPLGIFATSVVGGAMIATSLQTVLVSTGVHSAGHFAGAYMSFFAVLIIAGCVVQAVTTRSLPPRGAFSRTEGSSPAGASARR